MSIETSAYTHTHTYTRTHEHSDYKAKFTQLKMGSKRRLEMHTKVFHERIRSLRSSHPRAYWRILNSNNRQKKHTVDAISHDLFVEHFEKLGNIPEEELLHTFDNETDIYIYLYTII